MNQPIYRQTYRPLLERLSTGQVSTDISTNISTDTYQYTRWSILEVSVDANYIAR